MRRSIAGIFGSVAISSMLLAGCGASTQQDLTHISATVEGPYTLPTVNAVQYLSALDGWISITLHRANSPSALPNSGYLLHTSDGGKTWSTYPTGSVHVVAMDFLSPQDGFLVAGAGGNLEILTTRDGGASLTVTSSLPGPVGPVQMQFTSMTDGFVAAGGSISITTDGAASWTTTQTVMPSVTPSTTPSAPYFVNAQLAFVAQGDGISRSTDGGQTWQSVYTLPQGANIPATGVITFSSPTIGYAALGGTGTCWSGGCADLILRTEDGGTTWAAVSQGVYNNTPLTGITAPHTGPGGGITEIVAYGSRNVAVANMYGLAVSHNGGVTWVDSERAGRSPQGTFSQLAYTEGAGLLAAGASYLLRLPPRGPWEQVWPSPQPTEIDFLSANEGYGIGPQSSLGEVMKTVDGGQTWKALGRLPTGFGTYLSFAGVRRGLASAPGVPVSRILATSDGGRRWRTVNTAAATYLRLFPGGKGLAISAPTIYGTSELMATGDGGRRFTPRTLPVSADALPAIAFSTPSRGWAAWTNLGSGTNGHLHLYETADGAKTWSAVQVPSAIDVYSVDGVACDRSGDCWLLLSVYVGKKLLPQEEIYVLQSGGTWEEVQLPGGLSALFWGPGNENLSVVSATDVWLESPIGLLRTSDGGRTWSNLGWALKRGNLGTPVVP